MIYHALSRGAHRMDMKAQVSLICGGEVEISAFGDELRLVELVSGSSDRYREDLQPRLHTEFL